MKMIRKMLMTTTTSKTSFSPGEALCLADEVLSRPPAKPFIRRPELLPTRVFRAALPSELCLASNAWARSNRFADGAIKDKLWSWIEPQAFVWRGKLGYLWPFRHDEMWQRPQVIAIKFSARGRPDSGANFAKMPIDMLTQAKRRKNKFGVPVLQKHRLGIIVDDNETHAEQVPPWWEPISASAHSFVVLEIRV